MSATAPLSFTGVRLLIVDDEFFVAVHLEGLLEDMGCEVVGPVATIEDALRIIAAEHLDGVLLDANLNGVSSSPIAAELHARSIPFVVVTGYGKLELDTEALTNAPRVTKPIGQVNFGKILTATFLPRPAAIET
jgi:DNA-binding NtrC family response regulator